MTNEFFHQTATTTFLATPHRSQVIVSKLAAGAVLGVAFWLVTTVIDLAVGATYFSSTGRDVLLSDWTVTRSVLLNLLAFVIWAVARHRARRADPQPARGDHHRRRLLPARRTRSRSSSSA